MSVTVVKATFLEKNLSLEHFVHTKLPNKWPDIKHGLHGD
jgi:hypothetical protein